MIARCTVVALLLAVLSAAPPPAGAERLAVHTVRNYVRSIYGKLHVHSKSEAVSKALRARLM